jgi:hypothetical protein
VVPGGRTNSRAGKPDRRGEQSICVVGGPGPGNGRQVVGDE